jgi:hypothetical protein
VRRHRPAPAPSVSGHRLAGQELIGLVPRFLGRGHPVEAVQPQSRVGDGVVDHYGVDAVRAVSFRFPVSQRQSFPAADRLPFQPSPAPAFGDPEFAGEHASSASSTGRTGAVDEIGGRGLQNPTTGRAV